MISQNTLPRPAPGHFCWGDLHSRRYREEVSGSWLGDPAAHTQKWMETVQQKKIIALIEKAARSEDSDFSNHDNPEEQLFLGAEGDNCPHNGFRQPYYLVVNLPEGSSLPFLKLEFIERDEQEIWVWPQHFHAVGQFLISSNPSEKAYELARAWLAWDDGPHERGYEISGLEKSWSVVPIDFTASAKMIMNMVENHGAQVERLKP